MPTVNHSIGDRLLQKKIECSAEIADRHPIAGQSPLRVDMEEPARYLLSGNPSDRGIYVSPTHIGRTIEYVWFDL